MIKVLTVPVSVVISGLGDGQYRGQLSPFRKSDCMHDYRRRRTPVVILIVYVPFPRLPPLSLCPRSPYLSNSHAPSLPISQNICFVLILFFINRCKEDSTRHSILSSWMGEMVLNNNFSPSPKALLFPRSTVGGQPLHRKL